MGLARGSTWSAYGSQKLQAQAVFLVGLGFSALYGLATQGTYLQFLALCAVVTSAAVGFALSGGCAAVWQSLGWLLRGGRPPREKAWDWHKKIDAKGFVDCGGGNVISARTLSEVEASIGPFKIVGPVLGCGGAGGWDDAPSGACPMGFAAGESIPAHHPGSTGGRAKDQSDAGGSAKCQFSFGAAEDDVKMSAKAEVRGAGKCPFGSWGD